MERSARPDPSARNSPQDDVRTRLSRWIVVLFLLFIPALAQAQAPRLDVALKPQQVTVGDRITAVITVHAPAASLAGEPRFPVWGKSWGDAEILETGKLEKLDAAQGTAAWRQQIVLAGFRTGEIELPPSAVAVPLKERTLQLQTPAGLSFNVRSVLPPNEKDPQPKPPAALRPLPIGAVFWWTLAGMSALCALLLWALHRQSRRLREAAAERPALPPFDELIGALDVLEAEPSMLRLHTQISLALRRYLSRTFAVPALESTTSEMHRILLSRRLPAPLVRQAIELLRGCDLVKFARLEVGETRGRERVNAARQLARDLEQTMRPPEPVEPPARLEAAG
jgi:hypothetical protein